MKARRRMMLGGDAEAAPTDTADSSRSSSSSSSSLTPYEKEVAAIIMPAERRGIKAPLRERPPSPQEKAQAGNVLVQPAARRALRRPDLSSASTPASITIPPRGRAAEKASRARPRSPSSSPEYTYDDMMRDLYATGYMTGRPPTPENTTATVAARSRSSSPDLTKVLNPDFLRHHIHRAEDGDLEKNAIETARSRKGKGRIHRNDLISLDHEGRKQLYSELSRRKSELSPEVPIKIGPFQSSSIAAAPQTGAVIGRKAEKKRYIHVTGAKNGKVKHLSGYTSE